MEPQAIVALAIAIPVLLFPAAFVWHINPGGVLNTLRKPRARKTANTVMQINEKLEA